MLKYIQNTTGKNENYKEYRKPLDNKNHTSYYLHVIKKTTHKRKETSWI